MQKTFKFLVIVSVWSFSSFEKLGCEEQKLEITIPSQTYGQRLITEGMQKNRCRIEINTEPVIVPIPNYTEENDDEKKDDNLFSPPPMIPVYSNETFAIDKKPNAKRPHKKKVKKKKKKLSDESFFKVHFLFS